ncbi:MAG: radical SAM protein [Selenomonadaceae bacterium]|nr:radical SAM protein [Selenomonadaceae bacterium]
MQLENILKVYQRGEKFLILNPLVSAWIVTNLNGVLLVKTYAETQSSAEFLKHAKNISAPSAEKFLNKARGEGLFKIPAAPFFHTPYTLRAVYLNMTARCNLNCIYCFAAERQESNFQMTFDDYKKILDGVKNYNLRAEIIFTGGEPLLAENIFPVAEYSKKLGFKNKLMTNATLITEKNIEKIVGLFDSIKISLDGSTAEKHDFYRGRGSYERTIKAVELLEKFGADFSFAMVVTKNNCGDISAMAEKWGGRLIFQPLFPLGNAKDNKNLYLTGKDYFDALKAAGVVPFVDLQTKVQVILKCALGDAEISVSSSGEVYPCQLLHHDIFKIGNLKENSFDEIYNSEKLYKFKMHTADCIEKCKDCDLKLICGGACQARHFSETGSLDIAGDFCKYERNGIIEGLISAANLQAV